MRIFGALCGITGVVLLGTSFALAAGAPANASPAELIRFGHEHYSEILVGAWLQSFAPVLIAIFALALVHLSGAAQRVSGWMTLLGMSILIAVSLIEATFYVFALSTQSPELVVMSVKLINAIQHLYFDVAAPAVFLPVGLILLKSRILPAVFSYAAIGLAAVFVALGAIYMLSVTLPAAVTAVGAIQCLWWLLAAIFMAIRCGRPVQVASSPRTAR